jgi:hypothetical protein
VSLYKSERALDEIETSRIAQTTTSLSLGQVLMGGVSRSVNPGFQDQVDHALRSCRRRGRAVLSDPWEVMDEGQVLDVRLHGLDTGIMPFGSFAKLSRGGQVSVVAFWAHAVISPSWGRSDHFDDGSDDLHVVLVGSLENVVRARWATEVPDMVGHEFPSDPSFLSSVIASELGLDGPHVRQHIYRSEKVHDLDPGDKATFAFQETQRASESRRVDGAPGTWVRQRLRSARVVALAVDIEPEPIADAGRILVARPVLIQDLT